MTTPIAPLELSLPGLAAALRLPEDWLKDEADAGRLPHIRIGKRYRFYLPAVEAALVERAARGDASEAHAAKAAEGVAR